jgi:hypothetical protein
MGQTTIFAAWAGSGIDNSPKRKRWAPLFSAAAYCVPFPNGFDPWPNGLGVGAKGFVEGTAELGA